jgi:hypothetical protein
MASRSKSKVTTDHDEIRRWVEERGGRPAVVKATRGKGDDVGILRIDFPGFSGEGTLEPISWEEFFEKFDREGLAFVYQETTASGQKSNFNEIVKRETVMERAGGKRSRARKTSARGKSEKRGARATAGAKKAAGRKRSAAAGKSSTGRKSTRAQKTVARKSSGGKSTSRKARKRGRTSR